MAHKESTFVNMTLTLFLVTFISSAAFGVVYEKTKEPIAASLLARKINAIKSVVPEFDNNPIDEQYDIEMNGDLFNCFQAKRTNVLVGTAIQTTSKKGFGGKVKLMVGFLPDGAIYDISVVEHKETPGLGDKMERNKSNFADQFKKVDPRTFNLKVKNDGGDVDAITAATISSRAFCDAVEKAAAAYKEKGRP